VTYRQQCPRCGDTIEGEDREHVADSVIAHARDAHDHTLDRQVVLAHLAGVHPHEYDGDD
jgi:hypothetical protein